MKNTKMYIIFITNVIVVALLLVSCQTSKVKKFELLPIVCGTVFGCKPEEFNASEYGFTKATVNEDGNLILYATELQITEFKNNSEVMQIFQKIIGDQITVVTRTFQPTDELYGEFYEGAEVACGFEISEDYTKIVAGSGDDQSYFLIVPVACVIMQVFQGKPCDEVRFEYIELNKVGDIANKIVYPDDAFDLSNN